MNELQASMQIVLSNTFTMYFKSHSYHWNVEGMFFSQYHDFFGELYGELHGAVDPIAEQIRAIDGYGPVSLVDLMRYGTVSEDMAKPSNIRSMVLSLQQANQQIIDSLNKAFTLAEQENNQGLLDFIAGRLDVHAKHGWMLNSSLKTTGE